MLLFGGFGAPPAEVGKAMFATLSWMTLVFLPFGGRAQNIRIASSEERREGTLGLLFLTDLRGYDVVLGKLAACSLGSIYGLLAILPILALSLLLGGVSQDDFWRRTLALVNILLFSISVGIWASAQSRLERRAVMTTLVTIALFMAVPPLTTVPALVPISPGCSFVLAPGYRGGAPDHWRCSLLYTQIISWSLLAWASFNVSRGWDEEAADSPWWRPAGPAAESVAAQWSGAGEVAGAVTR